MKEPKLKTVYVCSNCGETSPRWMGRCPSCGSWNTMNEDVVAEAPKAGLSGGKAAAPVRQEGVTSLTARRLADISTTEEKSRIGVLGSVRVVKFKGSALIVGTVSVTEVSRNALSAPPIAGESRHLDGSPHYDGTVAGIIICRMGVVVFSVLIMPQVIFTE